MTHLEEYSKNYKNARLERDNGILQVTLHTDGGELIWTAEAHHECVYLFEDIARDEENKVIILTGTGESFIDKESLGDFTLDPVNWHIHGHYTAKRLMMNLLDIEQPMIAAINGPVTIHSDIPLLCDITLAADTAVFGDSVHSAQGVVPGDGVQVVWPALVGLNRARYALLTGERIPAAEAKAIGLINEVVPMADLLPRAWELARMLRNRPPVATRLTRPVMLQSIKKAMLDNIGYGLTVEGMAGIAYWPKS